MIMTRKQIEDAGWKFEFYSMEIGGYCRVSKQGRHFESALHPTDNLALSEAISIVTAIEQYELTSELLDEAAKLIDMLEMQQAMHDDAVEIRLNAFYNKMAVVNAVPV